MNSPGKEENGKNIRTLLIVITLLICLCGLFSRVSGFGSRNLEYDEIYTVTGFVRLPFTKIFTDVATPNNHMLHTFAVKLVQPPGTALYIPGVRLPAMAAGIGILLLLAAAGRSCSVYGACFMMILGAVNGALVHYSHTARGYTMQTFFLLACVLILLRRNGETEEKGGKRLIPLLFFPAAAGTCLSISSGVLFITAAGVSWMIFFFPWKRISAAWKEEKYFFAALLLTGFFVLAYYIPNAAEFAKGTTFGSSPDSFYGIMRFLWDTLFENDLVLPFLLTLCVFLPGTEKNRKSAVFLLTSAGLLLGSSLLTKCGPPRVYVPLCAFLIPSAGLGMDSLMEYLGKRGSFARANGNMLKLLLFLFFAGTAIYSGEESYRRLTPCDPCTIHEMCRKNTNGFLYPVFSPTDSFSLKALLGEKSEKDRADEVRKAEMLLLVEGSERITAAGFLKYSTKSFPLPSGMIYRFVQIKQHSFPIIQLSKIDNRLKKDDLVLLFLYYERIPEKIKKLDQFYLLNFLQTVNGPDYMTGVLITYAGEIPLTAEEMNQLETGSEGRIRFRVIR